MNRKKAPEIEKEKEAEKMGVGGVLQRGSHRPAARCMAEAHHSANYDQAFPCRHSSAGNGKSLFSHTPMEAMGHGAMQMRCLYIRIHSHTDTHTHTNTSKCAVLLTSHEHTGLTPTHTFLYTERRTHTQTPFTPQFALHACSHIHTGANARRKSDTNIIRFSFSPRVHLNIYTDIVSSVCTCGAKLSVPIVQHRPSSEESKEAKRTLFHTC